MNDFISKLFSLLIVAWIAFAVVRAIWLAIYTSSDHWGWQKDARPDENAVIVSVKPEFIRQKAFSKYATTMTFSDGFWFKTHVTKKVQKFARYEFSLDYEMLEPELAKAIRIHKEEVAKKMGHE